MAWWVLIIRLCLAVICGGVIGSDREAEGKPSGVRTQMLVCIGSCLFLVTGLRMHLAPGVVPDLPRLAEGVITGVGFLGVVSNIRYGSSIISLASDCFIWI